MRVDAESADRVIAAITTRLPEHVRIRRSGRSGLVVKSGGPKLESRSSNVPVFGHLHEDEGPGAAVEIALLDAIAEVDRHLQGRDWTWVGLDPGPVTIAVDRAGDDLVASITDQAGHRIQLPSVSVPADEDDGGEFDPAQVALLAELASGPSEVDSLALWLLRVGIDQTGTLTLNRPWDLAVRAMVLADLRRSGRLSDTEDVVEVDIDTHGLDHEDVACQQLIGQSDRTEMDWLRAGQLRASDVAAQLVATGEWTRPPLRLARQSFRAASKQHVRLRRRLAHTYDGDFAPLSDEEAALAVLGHALAVLRPPQLLARRGKSKSAWGPPDCGPLGPFVDAAVAEIHVRAAQSAMNGDPSW